MQDQRPPMVTLQGISKSYTQGPVRVEALAGIDLSLDRGEKLCIVGHSGSGKSTLLNIMGGLDWPDAGSVTFDGQELSRLSEPKLASFRNQRVGFVFQMHHLLPQMTVLENVLIPTLPRRLKGPERAKAQQRATELLDGVGLSARQDFFPSQLSGGERQRAAVVRALINEPPLLLADEPTGALDEASAWELAELLCQMQRERQLTLVVVTHWMELAGKLGNVRLLRDGHLEAGAQ